MISPQAIIEPGAKLGQNVQVYPFAYIQADVEIGDNTIVYPQASILNGSRIGANNRIFQNAVIGSMPQSFHFKEGTPVHVTIGDNNIIRENCVIAGGYESPEGTVIGNDNCLMDRAHLCHDVRIKNRCVVGINTILSSRVEIDSNTILSNSVVCGVGVRIGRYTLVQSGCRMQKDVPPYIILGDNPARYRGVNTTVLTQTGTDERTLRHIGNAYRLVYMGNFSLEDAILQIKDQIPPGEQIDYITSFIENSPGGIVRTMKDEG
ncbi:MAG: acyl-ACP--UDP-N-acetylglucosamine O-acyltransferase [Bacteroidaceae bacterium]|nr:acyl-ACP--UDP-N-acetylglucosamine O-acyltransferase [Bacteroidaceae bacterium]